MPDLDLPPGDYRERKPKGWRWKLPWSHNEDPKLSLVVFLAMAGWLVWVFTVRFELSPHWLFGGAAAGAFLAGWMLRSVFRD
jgi:hypothetical protein